MFIVFLWKQCFYFIKRFPSTLLWMCSFRSEEVPLGRSVGWCLLTTALQKSSMQRSTSKDLKAMTNGSWRTSNSSWKTGTGELVLISWKISVVSDLFAMAPELLRIAPNDLITIRYFVVLMSLSLMCLRKYIYSCWFQRLDLKTRLGFFRCESLFPLSLLCSHNMLTIFGGISTTSQSL